MSILEYMYNQSLKDNIIIFEFIIKSCKQGDPFKKIISWQ